MWTEKHCLVTSLVCFRIALGSCRRGEGGGGGGVIFCVQNMEIQGRWGEFHEIPSVVGVWIFSGTTH